MDTRHVSLAHACNSCSNGLSHWRRCSLNKLLAVARVVLSPERWDTLQPTCMALSHSNYVAAKSTILLLPEAQVYCHNHKFVQQIC